MRRDRATLSVFVFALAVRLAWLIAYPRVIENEGTQYARLAQNLFSHHGYVAMRGPATMISPLYAILIGAVSLLTQNLEVAGRVISLFSGALLPVFLFLICQRIYDRRAAWIAGILAAVHPALVALSGTVYSEPLYLTLLMAALYATFLAFDQKSLSLPAIAGVCLGLAYLARPEGLIYAALFALWIIAAHWPSGALSRAHLLQSATLFGLSIALALPFMLFLTARTGRFYWEGKSPINDNIVLRMSSGISYQQANTGLGPGLEEDGVALNDDQFVYASEHPIPLGVKLHLAADGWRPRLLTLLRNFRWAAYLGSPVIWLLAFIGVFAGPWTTHRVAYQGLLWSMTALLLAILTSMHFTWSRFLFPVLPLCVIWAAAGAMACYQFVKSFVGKLTSSVIFPRFAAATVPSLLIALLISRSARAVPGLGEFAEARSVEMKAAGLWIASQSRAEKTVMAIGLVAPFYAGATARILPYTDSDTALTYLHRKQPDFIVIASDEFNQRPYLADWIAHGIPDNCAHPVFRVGQRESSVVVYEWNCQQQANAVPAR